MRMGTWIVTGANRGIGLELARQLKARGERVVATCRTASKELEGLGVQVVTGVDIAQRDSHVPIAEAVKGERVDVLLHNAGMLVPDSLSSLTAEGLETQYRVNAVGPLLLTQALLPRLDRGSKIALISSRAGSIGDNGSGGLYGYRMSKAALNMAGMSLTRDLASRGILVTVLHPGFIRTTMTGGAGNDDPPVAAKGLLAQIDALDADRSGRFFHANGEELPW